jgi:hypothetical protein
MSEFEKFKAVIQQVRNGYKELGATEFAPALEDALMAMSQKRRDVEKREKEKAKQKLARAARGKIKIDKRSRSKDNVNPSEEWKKATVEWLVGLGVPEKEAGHHKYAHNIEVKSFGNAIWLRHSYEYRSYPMASPELSHRRAFIVNGEVVAHCEGDRNNCWNEYEASGDGSIEASEEEQWYGGGAREFDACALHALRRMAVEGVVYEALLPKED